MYTFEDGLRTKAGGPALSLDCLDGAEGVDGGVGRLRIIIGGFAAAAAAAALSFSNSSSAPYPVTPLPASRGQSVSRSPLEGRMDGLCEGEL